MGLGDSWHDSSTKTATQNDINVTFFYGEIHYNRYFQTRFFVSSSSIMTGIWARVPGFDSRWGKRFFSSPPLSDRLWRRSSLLCNPYRGFFLSVNLAIYFHLVPRWRIHGAIPPPFINLGWVTHIRSFPWVSSRYFRDSIFKYPTTPASLSLTIHS
jgi:hypothetical protein